MVQRYDPRLPPPMSSTTVERADETGGMDSASTGPTSAAMRACEPTSDSSVGMFAVASRALSDVSCVGSWEDCD